MHYYDQFKFFDPLTGKLPYWPFHEGNWIASRAKSVLYGRTDPEIRYLAQDASQMISDYFDQEESAAIEMLKSEGRTDLLESDEDGRFWRLKDEAVDSHDIRTSENTSDFDALQEALETLFDPSVLDVPNVNEYEYFAVMALCLIGDYAKSLEVEVSLVKMDYVQRTSKKYDSPEVVRLGRLLLEAMDAVCYAERLKERSKTQTRYEERIQKIQAKHRPISEQDIDQIRAEALDQFLTDAKAQRKLQSQESNRIRHQANYDAQKIVLEIWEQNPRQFSSAEKAGDHYVGILEARGIKRSHRTVVDWIRARAKELGIRFR